MQRKEQTRLLWARHTDRCWVPFQHILCTVDVPLVVGTSPRQYKLSQQDYSRVVTLYDHRKEIRKMISKQIRDLTDIDRMHSNII